MEREVHDLVFMQKRHRALFLHRQGMQVEQRRSPLLPRLPYLRKAYSISSCHDNWCCIWNWSGLGNSKRGLQQPCDKRHREIRRVWAPHHLFWTRDDDRIVQTIARATRKISTSNLKRFWKPDSLGYQLQTDDNRSWTLGNKRRYFGGYCQADRASSI